ncbi:beta-lactamase superfamily domain-containing protein [Pilobolus umbonatus]|nr:beta-lactamase superfamily domain-containing protein [Pilobolus umbonatus]
MVIILMSSVLYNHFLSKKTDRSLEATRLRVILKRKGVARPEDRYASLKIEKNYLNPFDEWTNIPFYKTALFWARRWKGNGIPSSIIELENALPVLKPDLDRIFNSKPHLSSTVSFTWFGQSTCLMTVDGLTILTDPVFSKRSINDYLGPKRLRPIPCQLEDFIDKVDIVLVSHDHFDHLDEAAVRKLGNSVTWYIPMGLGHWFLKRGIHTTIEMDWWQEQVYQLRSDITVACVPAMHWSGSRNPFEKNNTLWCSYIVKSKADRLFFCGDTGYCPELFKAIGNKYQPITLAAIPIGSFMPTTLMQHLHMGPEDAIRAHRDLGHPRLSVGIHWGTFMMSDEHYLAPRQVLNEAWRSYAEDSNRTLEANDERQSREGDMALSVRKLSDFITTAFGETIIVNQ